MGNYACACACNKNEIEEKNEEKNDDLESPKISISYSNSSLEQNYLKSVKTTISSKEDSKILKSITFNDDALLSKLKSKEIKLNYHKIKLLGKGGYGEVWLVKNTILNNYCAMKIIRKRGIINEDTQIKKEVDIMKDLDHPNIAKVSDFYSSSEEFYIISEYCPEGDLFEELIRMGRPFDEAECAFIMKQILLAMSYFHKMGVIHRDIKPENIMITKREDNGCLQIKVIDFGTSVIYSGNKENLLIGSSHYIAPEVLNKEYDERCDIWSLGVTLYLLLTYNYPFDSNSDDYKLYKIVQTGEYNKKLYEYERLSVKAKDLIDKFLTLDPEKRISVKDALQHDWFKTEDLKDKNKINIIEPNMARNLVKNISNYRKDNILKCAAIAYLIHNNINLEPCIEARKLFTSIDSQNDGRIQLEELIGGLKNYWKLDDEEAENKAKEIFNNLDADNSGHIEYEEFVRAAVNPKIFLYKNYLKFVFKFFDRDGSGDISLKEIESKFILNYQDKENVLETLLIKNLKKINIDPNKPINFEVFCKIMQNILKN